MGSKRSLKQEAGSRDRRGDALAFGSLVLAAFVCYGGPGIASLGFYVDDWHLLAGMFFAPPGWLSAMRGLVGQAKAIVFRPFEIPLFAGLYELNGLEPLRWQLSLMAMNLAAAWNLRRLAARFGADARTALIAAMLLLAWPSKDSTLFWSTGVFLPFSLAAFLGAYRLHIEFVGSGSRRALAGAAGLLIVSFTSYDQCLFLFPLWLMVPSSVALERRRTLIGTLAAAAVSALVVLYQLKLAPLLLGQPHNKTIILSLSHVLEVYGRGMDALFGPDLARRTLKAAWLEAARSPSLAVCGALAAAAAAAGPAPRESPPPFRLLALGAGIIALGYLPVALSDYMPMAGTHMNRINLVPAAGAAVLVGGILASARRPRAGVALGVLLACVLFVSQSRRAGSWAESYRRQLAMRDAVLSNPEQWPRETTLLIQQPELMVDGAAPVFLEHYDSSAAFRIWTGEADRKADVLTASTIGTAEGVENRGRKIPYASARLLHAPSGKIYRHRVPPARPEKSAGR